MRISLHLVCLFISICQWKIHRFSLVNILYIRPFLILIFHRLNMIEGIGMFACVIL